MPFFFHFTAQISSSSSQNPLLTTIVSLPTVNQIPHSPRPSLPFCSSSSGFNFTIKGGACCHVSDVWGGDYSLDVVAVGPGEGEGSAVVWGFLCLYHLPSDPPAIRPQTHQTIKGSRHRRHRS